MLKWLALFLLVAAPAHADPITTAIAGFATWYGGLQAATQLGIQLAASAAFTAGSIALQEKPRVAAIKRDLARPSSLPPYRFIYGRYRAYGSPSPFVVEGGRLYGCMVLNSRPSAGGEISIAFDKRELELTGNLLDLSGPGARPTDGALADHLKLWVALGDQDGPPAQIVAEVPDLFSAADIGTNMTLLWFRAQAGGKNNRLKRWPKAPPEIEVEMDWSKVWDPRDEDQDPDDPDTWTWNNNQALAVLDALRTNPIVPYRLDQIDLPTWSEAADIADQPVALKGGGTEPRYRANGIINWDSGELEQAIEPLILAGGGGVTRIGGLLAAIPGAWSAPEVTITDILDDDEMTVEVLQPGDDTFSGVRATYTDPGRDWQSADAGVYRVPGAQAADGGIEKIKSVDLQMVTSPTQAQRICKALALMGRKQRTITATLPPGAFQAVAGGTVTLALPEPFNVFNGAYEVQTINPGLNPVGEPDGPLAMRCPAVLRETGADIWAWNPATDEQDVLEVVQFDGTRPDLEQPGTITAVSGSAAALGSGANAQPRILFTFAPADSEKVSRYDVEYRISGGSWQDGGSIDADIRNGAGKVFGYVHPVQVGQSYDIRVRSRASKNDVSEWRTLPGQTALPPDVTLTPPTNGDANPGGTGTIIVEFRTPNSGDVQGIQIWTNTTNNSGTAVIVGPTVIYAGPNQYAELEHTGLTSGTTHHYWAKTVGPFGAVSAFSSRVFATAT